TYRLPWCESCLLRGQAVMLTSLTELPEDAELDTDYLSSFGVRSLALLPVEGPDADVGVLAFLSLSQSTTWSRDLAKQCAFVGSAFLSAHSRTLPTKASEGHFREAFRSASVGMALEDTSGAL